MIVIYRPNGASLLGYRTETGDIVAGYTTATDEETGETTYAYTNAEGDTVTLSTEPTPEPLVVGDDSFRQAELMGDDVLTLRFSMPENLVVPLRSWCIFEGRRYYLYVSPQITKQHSRHYDYVMPMFTSDYMLKITMMRNRTYNRSTGVYGGDLRLKFPLTATPREHLEMVAACLNDAETEPNAVWAVDYSKTVGMTAANNGAYINYDGTKYNDGGDDELVSYEFNYCIDAIRSQATAFNTEYEISDVALTSNGITTVYHLLSLHDVEYNKSTPLYMSYGKGNGFKSGIARKNESDLPPVDRLYIQGGEQNIPQNYGRTPKGLNNGTMTWDGDRSETLLLPRRLTNLSSGAPTSSSVYRGVVCFFAGGRYYFSLNPTVQTDSNGNRYIQQKNYQDPDTALPIYEVLYDEYGNALGTTLLIVPTPCYLVSDDGRSVERVRHTYYDPDFSPRGTKVESFYDASEVYPMRIGGVSQVQTITRTRQVDDGQGGTTTETYKLYDIIDALTDCPDYSQCSIDGETMTVIFQDGMLAGREFDLNTTESGVVICTDVTVYDSDNNPIPAKKLELCPSDQDGLTMPNETFKPRPGDHYIAFHCSLPKEYIGSSVADSDGHYNGTQGIAYGAEFRALKEMVRYLNDHGKETFTFSGSVDTLWVNRVWDDYVERYTGSPYNMNIPHSEYFNLGQHIKVTDVQLFGSQGLVMRVTGIKQPVNSPRSIELTLTNAIVLKYNWVKHLSQTVEAVRVRPRYRRPDNPIFPWTGRVDQNVVTDEMLDPQGNPLDLRRKNVVPISMFKDIVGLNIGEGLQFMVGDLIDKVGEDALDVGGLLYRAAQLESGRSTHMGKINEIISSLYSANQILVSIQNNFNTLRSQLVARSLINQSTDSGTVNELGIMQCSYNPLSQQQECTASPTTIGVPNRLQN